LCQAFQVTIFGKSSLNRRFGSAESPRAQGERHSLSCSSGSTLMATCPRHGCHAATLRCSDSPMQRLPTQRLPMQRFPTQRLSDAVTLGPVRSGRLS